MVEHRPDDERFEVQRTAVVAPLVETIRSRGYWEVVIRPADFDPARLPAPPALAEVVRSCAVRLVGWSFPQATALGDVAGIGPDWVDRASEWWRYLEY